MTMKRTAVATAAVLLAILLGACEPEQDGGDKHQTKPRIDAGQAKPKQNDNGNAQPAPVQGDPSAHNTQPGHVGLFLTWESENNKTPACEWTRNGAVQPCANMRVEHEGNTYVGFWEHEETAKAGDVYTLNAEGTGAVKWITCEIFWKGNGIEGPKTSKRCGVTRALN